MTTLLGQQYSTTWRGKPPHMLAPDIPVWYRFLDKHQPPFIALYYDCLLGATWQPGSNQKDPMEKMWRDLTAKRADAIAETQAEVWLIEVAAYPGMRSLGQLLTYETLWHQDPKIDKPHKKILVAEQTDPNISASYPIHGVSVHLV